MSHRRLPRAPAGRRQVVGLLRPGAPPSQGPIALLHHKSPCIWTSCWFRVSGEPGLLQGAGEADLSPPGGTTVWLSLRKHPACSPRSHGRLLSPPATLRGCDMGGGAGSHTDIIITTLWEKGINLNQCTMSHEVAVTKGMQESKRRLRYGASVRRVASPRGHGQDQVPAFSSQNTNRKPRRTTQGNAKSIKCSKAPVRPKGTFQV